jgi:Protein of unknown function (DUF1552)/Ankyrin repeats (3 copies)
MAGEMIDAGELAICKRRGHDAHLGLGSGWVLEREDEPPEGPAQTPLARTVAVPKTRFTGIFVPHGMAPGWWIPTQTGAGDHWVAAAYLCANKPKKTTGADIYDGTTIDQLIARKIGQETLLPSLELGVEDLLLSILNICGVHQDNDKAGGLTPLLIAAREDCLECAKILLAGGADVNQTGRCGWTPLMTATQNRHYVPGSRT